MTPASSAVSPHELDRTNCRPGYGQTTSRPRGRWRVGARKSIGGSGRVAEAESTAPGVGSPSRPGGPVVFMAVDRTRAPAPGAGPVEVAEAPLGLTNNCSYSPITLSPTLSPTWSHAWTAAAWNASNLHCDRKSPSRSMTSWGQSSAGMNTRDACHTDLTMLLHVEACSIPVRTGALRQCPGTLTD
jgi:hypothetical protein